LLRRAATNWYTVPGQTPRYISAIAAFWMASAVVILVFSLTT
jgi:hypothetical protein